MAQNIIISKNLRDNIETAISQCKHDKLFVLTDETTLRMCWPKLSCLDVLAGAQMITIEVGDTNKTIETAAKVWAALTNGGATRRSCLINLGGGMVTDLGGFVASTFKRGISFINVPTTLLAMVDASVGGKTGVNFANLKNEIGVFSDSNCVVLDTVFLDTLDEYNFRSGYAEMLKHGLISSNEVWENLISFDLNDVDLVRLQDMVADSVEVKKRIVEADPHEQGIRKALNVGHTAGHAIESWAMIHSRPMLHGYAVAFGIICELFLSRVKMGFPADKMRRTVNYIRSNYGSPHITCSDYEEILSLMKHDKKNTDGVINFSLLSDIGEPRLNCVATKEEITEALDFLNF